MTILGSSPPFPARPVSLAAREYLRTHVKGGAHGVIIAVSGGADSLSLCLAVADYTQRKGIPTVAVIVDHGLRGESHDEAHRVRQQLLETGVEQAVVLTGSTAADRPLEGAARDLRHELLHRFALTWAAENGLSSLDILLGHTMDDQAETVLMRLGRGASPRALAAMRARTEVASESDASVKIFRGRPLLDLRRAHTEAFCAALGLSWVEDPSNSWEGSWLTAAGQPLVRNALRHQVIPQLGEALGQDPVPALARVAALLADDEDALTALAHHCLERAVVSGGGVSAEGALVLNVETLAVEPVAVRRRVYLLAWRRVLGGTVVGEHPVASVVRGVDDLVTNSVAGPKSPVGKWVELAGVRVERSRQHLTFRA